MKIAKDENVHHGGTSGFHMLRMKMMMEQIQNNNKNREDEKCKICYENEGDYLLVPCGHKGLCSRCCDKILTSSSQCPICKTYTYMKQRVHNV